MGRLCQEMLGVRSLLPGVGMWEAGLREALGYITMSNKKRMRVSQGIGAQTE